MSYRASVTITRIEDGYSETFETRTVMYEFDLTSELTTLGSMFEQLGFDNDPRADEEGEIW